MTADTARSPTLAATFHAAATLVAGVLAGRTPDAALARLEPALRPAATEATFATLRDFGRGDFFLAQLMERPLKESGVPLVRALLLIALHRLEREPEQSHTIVDQAVNAAALINDGRSKGLVNGVLRNFLRRQPQLLAAAEGDEVATWRHPAWWLARLRIDHPDQWQDIAAAGNRHPPMSLRANLRRLTSADLAGHLAQAGIAAEVLPGGAVHLAVPCPVVQLPGFAEGECSVQDAGAQRAANLLDVHDGMRVLDACAAPGGKAAHILELADAQLLALDADRQRARRVEDNLRRLGLRAQVKVADARHSLGIPSDSRKVLRPKPGWWDGVPFERILADVPCSASGVVRRHADAKWLRREADIESFARTQAEILDALWPTLAPGGKMLYATCSVFCRENTRQVAQFLKRHPDAELAEPETCLLPDDRHDGFFYALLRKT